jgi:hypothetical protein
VTPAQLMAKLTKLGIRLEARGDKLGYSPRSVVTPDLVKQIVTHKGELLVILKSDVEVPSISQLEDLTNNPGPCPACGSGVLWRLPNGQVVCDCQAKISIGSERVVHFQSPDGDFWESHSVNHIEPLDAKDSVHLELGPDGWPLGSFEWPAPGDPLPQGASTNIEAKIPQGICDRCGSDEYVDTPIHNGRSLRRDCSQCGRFLSWPKWNPAPVQ